MATSFFSHVYNNIVGANIWSTSKPFLCLGRPVKISDASKKLANATNAATQLKDIDDRNQFWRSAKYDVDYWQTYLDARPKYDVGDFYQRLLNYHQSHQSPTDRAPTIAHDVGTGPGQVAAVLSKHFDQVVASDLNNTHLEVAYHLLNLADEKRNISLTCAGGEDLINHHPHASASIITAAECMPLMNVPVAIDAWSRLLRPHGTLAMWFYGRPAFETDDTSFNGAACNAIYEQIASRAFRPFYDVQGPRLANVRKAMDTMVNWLDNIDLDPAIWSDVQRWKWNSDIPMEFSHAQDLGWPVNRISKIRKDEKVEQVPNRHMWSETWSIDDWKKFLKVNLPAFNGEWDHQIQALWRDLETAMGGNTARRRVIWPVVCIVATRRETASVITTTMTASPSLADDADSGYDTPISPSRKQM